MQGTVLKSLQKHHAKVRLDTLANGPKGRSSTDAAGRQMAAQWKAELSNSDSGLEELASRRGELSVT